MGFAENAIKQLNAFTEHNIAYVKKKEEKTNSGRKFKALTCERLTPVSASLALEGREAWSVRALERLSSSWAD